MSYLRVSETREAQNAPYLKVNETAISKIVRLP